VPAWPQRRIRRVAPGKAPKRRHARRTAQGAGQGQPAVRCRSETIQHGLTNNADAILILAVENTHDDWTRTETRIRGQLTNGGIDAAASTDADEETVRLLAA